MSSSPSAVIQVVDVARPESLDDDGAWGVRAVSALERSVQTATWGHHDLAYSPQEVLVALRDDRYVLRQHLIAVGPDAPRDVVGVAFCRLPRVGNTHLLEAEVLVRPDRVGRGVDDALLAAVLERAAQSNRRVVVLSSEHRGEPGAQDPDALPAPTGSGRVRRSDPGAALAERFGFELEQAERYSVLPLPAPPGRIAALRESAARAAGDAYRTLTWAGRCPDEWVEEFARLETRMSTDAPSAGLEVIEDPWDLERVRAEEEKAARADRGRLVTAVEHVATGTLAAFTCIEYPLASSEFAYQHDTLVARAHRGRRLGLLAKTVNLERLVRARPGTRRVHTWNAGENSFMLAINVALGYEPVGVCGVWQRHVA